MHEGGEVEKNCFTCKYEPDWDSCDRGDCKKQVELPDNLPACIKKDKIVKLPALPNVSDHDMVVAGQRFIINCLAWEEK